MQLCSTYRMATCCLARRVFTSFRVRLKENTPCSTRRRARLGALRAVLPQPPRPLPFPPAPAAHRVVRSINVVRLLQGRELLQGVGGGAAVASGEDKEGPVSGCKRPRLPPVMTQRPGPRRLRLRQFRLVAAEQLAVLGGHNCMAWRTRL